MKTAIPVPTFHLLWSVPKYPLKAFLPQGQSTGLQMGANADTDFRNKGNLKTNYILLNQTWTNICNLLKNPEVYLQLACNLWLAMKILVNNFPLAIRRAEVAGLFMIHLLCVLLRELINHRCQHTVKHYIFIK